MLLHYAPRSSYKEAWYCIEGMKVLSPLGCSVMEVCG